MLIISITVLIVSAGASVGQVIARNCSGQYRRCGPRHDRRLRGPPLTVWSGPDRLTDGPHSVTITVSAHKNQASQCHDISLDAVEVQR
ncbi:hypothetical protein ACFCYB_35635 [Streptomyces sp. NPDC056309]|uniref:hypothetical protein n=1 Tax=unclassified Streptomyces TaxID=2593676 RepID=UPI0035DF601E